MRKFHPGAGSLGSGGGGQTASARPQAQKSRAMEGEHPHALLSDQRRHEGPVDSVDSPATSDRISFVMDSQANAATLRPLTAAPMVTKFRGVRGRLGIPSDAHGNQGRCYAPGLRKPR
jgi:hypothetical protein